MELKNEFRVNVPIDTAWATLTDVEYIAPCMPGAQLTEIDGDDFKGQVKVKVGPITAQYKGQARFVEKDEQARRAVLNAKGRDTRGAGNAEADVIAQMTEEDGGTRIEITTDLKVTGKVAQFGRGVMADVSEKLIGQFVASLEAKLAETGAQAAASAESAGGGDAGSTEPSDDASAGTETAATASEPSPSGPRKIDMPEPEPVDLLDTAGAPVVKRLLPLLAVVVVLLLLRRRRR